MSAGTERLVHRLALTQIDKDDRSVTWQGTAGENAMNMAGRLFGGMVLAQTVVAAGRTIPDRRIHSLQQVFLRGGQPTGTIDYHCEVLFEGRTYASARVEVHQHDQIISHAQIGFTAGVDGPEHTTPPTPPGDFADTVNRDEYRKRRNWRDQPVEVRALPGHEDSPEPHFATWVKPYAPLPDDPLIHQAFLAFISDRAFMSTAWKPVRGDYPELRGATLDHSIWFHRPVRFDNWHLYSMQSQALVDGRGLVHGTMHDEAGTMIASLTQQGAMRAGERRTQ